MAVGPSISIYRSGCPNLSLPRRSGRRMLGMGVTICRDWEVSHHTMKRAVIQGWWDWVVFRQSGRRRRVADEIMMRLGYVAEMWRSY